MIFSKKKQTNLKISSKNSIRQPSLNLQIKNTKKNEMKLVLNCLKFPKRASTAIIVPYKDREEHLKLLLRYLHPNLQRQQISYCIFIAEQFHDGRFNKKGFLY